MNHATFSTPDLTTFARLDELGLEVTGQLISDEETVLACRVVAPDDWCHWCGCQGVPRDTVIRRLAHTPMGHRPTILRIRVRRYRCTGCGHVWRQNTDQAAEARAKLSRGGLAWALEGLVLDPLPVSRIAAGLGVDWTTANDAVLAEGTRRLIDDPHRFEGVEVIGVDEHVWRHTSRGDKYVTVIIDLTPLRDGTGASRLLDMVAGRSKKVFKTWLAGRDQAWRDRIQIVAMDGFTGFKTAAAEELPAAVEVVDPFHVVQLAGDQLDVTRQRVQQDTTGHRGRAGDPLFGVRLTLHTGRDLLTDRQAARLEQVFAADAHAPVQVTWAVYQEIVAAYRAENRAEGRRIMAHLIDAIATKVPKALPEVTTLGHTLKKRADDILAYFDHPGTSNGPSEAINGRLEHLRGIALGFRNLTHYITRSLLETGGFRPRLHPGS
ncbi:ISL3 family transposase [Acidipropionibacterium timonense]|uniref:ISL3 family transposase n=1 Tax=Acidipropionibacterium timonense TaxID=2161818 RepID=UPI0010323CE0|nr:ISL3 family transposase [Acidipropionibacterium timonense]